MSFPGPISVTPINSANDQDFGLRAFQRITAQIVSVTGTTAVIEVDGHPVVAQLTSADQALALTARQTAQFIVTELTGQSVTLKLVKNEQASPANIPGNASDLAARILDGSNIPATVANLMMARSLLRQNLPVTPRLLKELQSALSEYGNWDEADSDLAAAMKSAGLPVTAQSLALVSRQPAQTARALSQLIQILTRASGRDFPQELLNQLRSSLQGLNSMILQGGGDSSGMADQLKAMVDAFGRSLENLLLAQIQNPQASLFEHNLPALIRLMQMLEQFGEHETARSINELMKDIQRNQFMNVKAEQPPHDGEWSEIGFMIQSAAQKAEDQFSSARLRIARDAKEDASRINPAYTRLILQVDLEPGKTVEVDLSLAGKQIRTSVTAPDLVWCAQAKQELPSLAGALNDLGYFLKDAQVEVGEPRSFDRVKVFSGNVNLMAVNIEV